MSHPGLPSLTRRNVAAALVAGAFAPYPAIAASGPPLPPALDALGGLNLATWDGAPARLGQHAAPGRCAVVHFWATWCAPCLSEARHLTDWRRRVPLDRLALIGINVDSQRDEVKLAEWVRRSGANYTLLRGDRTNYAAFGLGDTIILPRLFVFARDGKPRAAFGRYDGGTLGRIDRAIADALAG
ncbi:TlpA disulfide reductase family protein [Sphingomonas sp.]|uniref:TlpA family protein disulfide reductase n=1 Tax=Sphingomonas sp. TaxID=28214 RepID=UPI001E0D75D8|nr:TlpA disulfide reductase family protein [Sphingomonas sp.]MBX9796862.1 TlpA family protein disulfide reductase [Sphingomonas sp.]